MKLHNNHAATCLCCIHFEMEEAGGDGTNYEYAKVICHKKVFEVQFGIEQRDIHDILPLAQTCDEYEGQEQEVDTKYDYSGTQMEP